MISPLATKAAAARFRAERFQFLEAQGTHVIKTQLKETSKVPQQVFETVPRRPKLEELSVQRFAFGSHPGHNTGNHPGDKPERRKQRRPTNAEKQNRVRRSREAASITAATTTTIRRAVGRRRVRLLPTPTVYYKDCRS